MLTSPHLACSLTPLFLAVFLVAYAIIFLTTERDRKIEFLNLIPLNSVLVIYCHWLDDFCSPDLTTHIFNHQLNNFFVIPFCMYPFSIVAVRWVIERLLVAKAWWYKTILAFTILEVLIIMYVYHAVSVAAVCPCLQLTQELPLPYGMIQVDFLFVESMQFVLKWWFAYCVWRVQFLPFSERNWFYERNWQHYVWIFMIFAGLWFVYIDVHAIFFLLVVVYTLFEYFCVSKLFNLEHEGFPLLFTCYLLLLVMYLK